VFSLFEFSLSYRKDFICMRRMILIPLLMVIVLLAIAGGVGYYIYNSYAFYTTDDSQATGSIVSINAPAQGTLSTLSVKLGDNITAGQVLGTVSTTAAATPTTSTTADTTKKTINVTSPISGTIIQVPGVQGQDVTPGLPVLQVTNLNTVSITAYVDENAINNIKVGQDVDIHIDAYSDTTFKGSVQQIVDATAGSFSLLPASDNASGNFTKVAQRVPVVITLDGNSGKNVMPGMSAEVTIHIH
jgi:multidrug resistance efflux pump